MGNVQGRPRAGGGAPLLHPGRPAHQSRQICRVLHAAVRQNVNGRKLPRHGLAELAHAGQTAAAVMAHRSCPTRPHLSLRCTLPKHSRSPVPGGGWARMAAPEQQAAWRRQLCGRCACWLRWAQPPPQRTGAQQGRPALPASGGGNRRRRPPPQPCTGAGNARQSSPLLRTRCLWQEPAGGRPGAGRHRQRPKRADG